MIEKNSHLPEVDLMDFCLSDILTSRKVGLECHEKIPDRVRCYLRDIELVYYANHILTFGLIPSVEKILPGKEIRNNIEKLLERNDVEIEDQVKILMKAKEIKQNFLIDYVLRY